MRISHWLRVLVSCAIAGIVVLAIYGKWQVGRIYASASYANTATVPGIIALDDARAHVMRLKLLLYRHVIDHNPTAKEQLEPRIQEELLHAGASLQTYARQLIDAQDRRMLQDDQRLLDGYAYGIADILEHSRTDNGGIAQAELSMQKELGDKLEDALDQHVRYNVAQGAHRDRLAVRTFRQASWTTAAFVLAVVGTLLAIGYTIGRRITGQVDQIRKLAQDNEMFRTIAENSPDMIIRYDLECRRIYINQAFLNASRLSAEEVLGKPMTALAWWSLNVSAQEFEQHLRQVMRTGEPVSIRLYGNTPSTGQVRHTLVHVVPEYGADGQVASLMAVVRDVTDLVLAQQELQQREQYQRALLDNFPFFVWLKDTESRLLAANAQYARVAKVDTTRDLEGKTDFDFFPPDLARSYVEDDRHVLQSGQPKNVVEMYCDEHGRRRWMETYKSPVAVAGKVAGTVGFARDITEQMQLQMDLANREQEFRALVENSPDTVTRFDHDCRRVYANPSMVEESGLQLSELLGKTPEEFPGGAQAVIYQEKIRQVFDSGEPGNFELFWRTGDGDEVCSHIRLTPELGMDGEVAHVLAVGRDITEIDTYRKQIHSLAFFDSLTALPNRALLLDRIHQTIADASWHGSQFGLMLLDLDRFKEINDTLGHGVGDLLLRAVSDRLLDCVRSYDTVARLGGDEFAILLPEVRDGKDLATVARKILEAFQQPLHLSGKELFISTSIGIALYPGDSAEIDALFKYADSAMYHAKKQGRNNFQFYSRELTARSSERMVLENALRRAHKNDELELYYQPQVDLASGRIVGAEALLRWNRGEHGMVTPDRFIPVAEETGLIVGIGEWVLDTACRTAVAWNQGRDEPFKIAVNLSTRQFIQNELLGSVRGILMATECKPEWLKLEITESLLLEDSKDIVAILEALDAMGLALSIDDFGTGYSALSYLNRFPVSQIKIDRSFVQGIPEERDKAELVKAMISIAQTLQLELIAEGVETAHQAQYLNAHGCGIAQGYLFGKPMPRHVFEKRLAEELPDVATRSETGYQSPFRT